MPTGKYDNAKRNIKGLKFYKKGECPAHIKVKVEKKLKKIEKFKNGLDVECKKHGSHKRWRLHSGNNVQCLECAKEWQMNQRRRNPLRFIHRDAKKHAEYYKRSFFINLQDLEVLMLKQESRCALTGIEFSNENPPSLDRINSDIGYEVDNIQLVLIKVNKMKSDLDQESFIKMCEKIVTYSVKRKSQSKGRKK